MAQVGRVAVVSLDPWDQVWRRNQHLVVSMLRQGLVREVVYVEPARRGTVHVQVHRPQDSVQAVRPVRMLPQVLGGVAVLARTVTRVTCTADVLWVNDPIVGARCLVVGQPAVYDVTDDWRDSRLPARVRRRLVGAEDRLAGTARTVVCSGVLRERWQERYGVRATLVHNAIDTAGWGIAAAQLPGPGPHVAYVGSLHSERLDIGLVQRLARDPVVGTLHLIGPDYLDEDSRAALDAESRIRRWGAVPHDQVPALTRAADVLICPHKVDAFTLSLDAIKAYEYLASGRPVVATPTSGFQRLQFGHVHVVAPESWLDRVLLLLSEPQRRPDVETPVAGWDERARVFAEVLATGVALGPGVGISS